MLSSELYAISTPFSGPKKQLKGQSCLGPQLMMRLVLGNLFLRPCVEAICAGVYRVGEHGRVVGPELQLHRIAEQALELLPEIVGGEAMRLSLGRYDPVPMGQFDALYSEHANPL